MRLFAGIDLDDAARAAIAAEQKRLARALDAGGSLRWVKPEQMHLTLAFLGEVDDTRAAAVVDAMRRPIPAAPATIVIRGLGVFPPRGAPTVLWVGIADGSARVVEVQRIVADRLEQVGCPREARPFHPHLTLARWRDGGGARPLVFDTDRGGEVVRLEVNGVTLYQSRLSPNGSTYTAMARADLTS